MMQCKDCEYYSQMSDGSPHLACDAFSTIKEPECLAKLQLFELMTVSRSHQATLDLYRRFAPLQEKMFKQVERELNDVDEADKWKKQDDDDNDDDPFAL